MRRLRTALFALALAAPLAGVTALAVNAPAGKPPQERIVDGGLWAVSSQGTSFPATTPVQAAQTKIVEGVYEVFVYDRLVQATSDFALRLATHG